MFTEGQMFLFLRMYEESECLWKTDDIKYRNRQCRERALENIVKTLNIPKFAVSECKIKIKNVRSQYVNEVRKIINSEKSGCGVDDTYTPSLFWFEEADRFLRKYVKIKTESNLQIDKIVEESSDQNKSEDVSPKENPQNDTAFTLENDITITESLNNEPSIVPLNLPKRKKVAEREGSSNNKTYIDTALDQLDKISKRNVKPETEFDIYCRSVAKQLNDMPLEMALRCQFKIQEILTNFRLENQTQSHFHLTATPSPVHIIHYSSPPSVQSVVDDNTETIAFSAPVESNYNKDGLSFATIIGTAPDKEEH